MTEIDLNCYSRHFCIFRFANGLERCITTVQTSIEIAGIIMAHRTQVPLALAWAVSIHKSQVSSWAFRVNNLFLTHFIPMLRFIYKPDWFLYEKATLDWNGLMISLLLLQIGEGVRVNGTALPQIPLKY